MTDNRFANQSIQCNVTSCKYHNKEKNYCSLDVIKVATNEPHPTDYTSTCCDSFAPKSV